MDAKEIQIPAGLEICMGDRLKRMAAFLIDWNLTLLPFVLAAFFIAGHVQLQAYISALSALSLIFFILSAFVLFLFRDVVCFGRSLGKRIFGLHIFDKELSHKSTVKQRILRNVFFFLYAADGIVLLITGRTIGDRVANTMVFSSRSVDKHQAADNREQNPASHKKRTTRIVILAVVICMALFVGFIQTLLNAQKDNPEYLLAYDYLISSEAFAQTGADASQIRMNSYSASRNLAAGGSEPTRTVEIGFIVKFRSFTVVCHMENGTWQVCEECTGFV